ncbi:MAG: hypothetical protein LIP77_01050 [Planctomycetes bacterium]|nr:hypothetical protein [Planctomycetota bacterium]
MMTRPFAGVVLALLLAVAATVLAADEQDREQLTCRPVHGTVALPGIRYDDLSPLARQVFHDDAAAVSDALYALPLLEREEFKFLYLMPEARERHRYFFARCREVAERRAVGMAVAETGVPAALRRELLQREDTRRRLLETAKPFRLPSRVIFIPAPEGFQLDDGPFTASLRERGMVDSLAVYGKTMAGEAGTDTVLATINVVRESNERAGTVLAAYRTMVDADWRIAGVHPPDAPHDEARGLQYSWRLQPFAVREHSFCYGQFEKTVDRNGGTHLTYRATAVIALPGAFIQVSLIRTDGISVAAVEAMNSELDRWRDGIVAANWQYGDRR